MRGNKHINPWTDERVELLKKLWGGGLSGSQIAGELCCGLTRNSVIGKVHRLGLPTRARVNGEAGSLARGLRKPRAKRQSRAVAWKRPLSPENIIPVRQRRTLLQLTENTCRWPIGDPATPEFFFCGARPLDGLPYCNYHSRAAYQPASERRARAQQASVSPYRAA